MAAGVVAAPAQANDASWSYGGDTARWDDSTNTYWVNQKGPDNYRYPVLETQRTSSSTMFRYYDLTLNGRARAWASPYAEDVRTKSRLCQYGSFTGQRISCGAWKSYYT